MKQCYQSPQKSVSYADYFGTWIKKVRVLKSGVVQKSGEAFTEINGRPANLKIDEKGVLVAEATAARMATMDEEKFHFERFFENLVDAQGNYLDHVRWNYCVLADTKKTLLLCRVVPEEGDPYFEGYLKK